MDSSIVAFFDKQPDALPLYLELENSICSQIDNVRIDVKKTQISFYNKHMFACASLLRARRKSELPHPYLTVTFGLDHRVNSPRIDIATEAHPHRWTHHLVIGRASDIDEELMAWIREAAAFSAAK